MKNLLVTFLIATDCVHLNHLRRKHRLCLLGEIQYLLIQIYAFFCQNTHDEKGRSILNQVETMETGVKISNAVKQGNTDVLKVRLNNAIESEDARAADFKYHLNAMSKM